MGHAIEPTAYRRALANGAGLAGEDQKGRLKNVLGVLVMVEDPPADAQDRRSMPFHEGGEGGFVAAAREALEQLTVRHGRVPGLPELAQVP
jgi:hypothetical protein